MRKHLTFFNIMIMIIIAIAFVVRVWGIGRYPTGFTQDEASFGYDAYSLLQTGKDQWGERWPLVLRSFGDFKLPLYSYLTIPSVAVFGLNEFATRLPNAIFGFLAVIATYLMISEMTKNRNLAILSSLFLALSPWHISLSRGAFEANLTTFFMTAGIWAYLRGLKNKKWMVLSSVFLGLNLFSYHSARLITPIIYFLVVMIFYSGKWQVKSLFNFVRDYKFAVLTLTAFTCLAVTTMFYGGGKRGADILITNPTDKWESVSNRRYEAVLNGLADKYSRLFSNKVTYTLKLFFGNYLSYISPTFLFTQGAGEWNYGMIPGRGVLYSFELVTVLVGLFSLFRKRSLKGLEFIVLWILIAPIPAAVTKGPGYAANRAAVMMPAVQIFSAYGALSLYLYLSKIIKSKHIRTVYFSLLTFIVFVSSVFFFEDFMYHQPIHAASSMQVANSEIISKVLEIETAYQKIYISRTLSVPQIWVAFNSGWDPVDYQIQSQNWLEYEKAGYIYIDQFEGYRLGKYSFGSLDMASYKNINDVLIVGKPEEFPDSVDVLLTSKYPDGSVAFQAVESKDLK